MKFSKYHRAFTLLEMMIALVLSSIVFSMSFMCYSAVYRQFKDYKTFTGEVNELEQLDVALHADFFTANHIYDGENNIAFEFEDRPAVYYSFFGSVVIRETNNRVDSFMVSVSEMNRRSHVDAENNTKLMYELSFSAGIKESIEPFRFEKKYSPADLMYFEEPVVR